MTTVSQRKDIEQTVAGVHRQVKSLASRACEEDPWVLGEMLKIREDIDTYAVTVVAALRSAGYTWETIGQELGLSKQATFNRWGKRVAALQLDTTQEQS